MTIDVCDFLLQKLISVVFSPYDFSISRTIFWFVYLTLVRFSDSGLVFDPSFVCYEGIGKNGEWRETILLSLTSRARISFHGYYFRKRQEFKTETFIS